MEYRHGPISAINERSLVWILDDQEPSIDEQIRATGARLIRGEGDPLAELVRIHRFAEGLVELKGINPDQPPHISRSVVLAGDR
jgi:fructoselysine-6-P-deglycase FrlB-like protein